MQIRLFGISVRSDAGDRFVCVFVCVFVCILPAHHKSSDCEILQRLCSHLHIISLHDYHGFQTTYTEPFNYTNYITSCVSPSPAHSHVLLSVFPHSFLFLGMGSNSPPSLPPLPLLSLPFPSSLSPSLPPLSLLSPSSLPFSSLVHPSGAMAATTVLMCCHRRGQTALAGALHAVPLT